MKIKSRDRLYVFWSFSIIVCLILSLFSLIFVSCSPAGKNDPTPTVSTTANNDETNPPASPTATPIDGVAPPVDTHTPEPTVAPTPPPPTKLEVTADMGEEYLSGIIFLGDSTTFGLSHYGYATESQIWTPLIRTLTLGRHNIDKILYPDTDEEIFLKDAAALKKPELMVITLGVNGISFLTEEGFKSEYNNLIATIKEASPDTKIIINTIYPVATSYKHLASINNEKIDAANTWLLSIAEENGVRFMDSNSVLRNENGVLPETAHNGDGLHLNSDSFAKVVEFIRTHGYR